MLIKKRQRDDAEVPGSSMADIAFLLLIFFLLVTTIDVDTGIGLVLPPKPDTEEPPPLVKERNLLNIAVNAEGLVLLDDQPTPIVDVRQKVIDFVDNNGQNPDLSDSPDKAIVSIKTSRQTPYRIYIDMLDEVIGAYTQLRNEASQARFGRDFHQLDDDGEQFQQIKDLYPKKISIAEPDEG